MTKVADETIRCVWCAEEILAVAKKCKHCGEMLDVRRSEASQRRMRIYIAALAAIVVLFVYFEVRENTQKSADQYEHDLKGMSDEEVCIAAGDAPDCLDP